MQGNYCHQCGRPNPQGAPPARRGELLRPRQGRKVAGVCLAFARSLDWDPNLVRVLWVVASIFGALVLGVIAYVVAWILIPEEPLALPLPQNAPQAAPGA